MSSYFRDFVHVVRSLLRARAFLAVCVLSLGLGMGVVIGILLFIRMVLGVPQGVQNNGMVELVIRPSGQLLAQAGTGMIDTWSYPDYLDVRDGTPGMAVTGWSLGEGLILLPGQTAASPAPTMFVSSNYFSTVGAPLARGRGFTPADDASLAPAEAVIGHRAWQVRFDSDPNIIGRAVTINQTEYTIVGVAAEGFRGHLGGLDDAYQALWLPLSRHSRLTAAESARFNRQAAWVRVVARLSDGTTVPQADAMVQSVMAGLAGRFPATHHEKAGGAEPYFPFGARRRSQALFARLMMLGLSSMVLLIVGLNLSGMMLVRSAMRERGTAIRLAMGASRWRLMQYHLSEALVLAVFGGGLASAVLFAGPVFVAWAFGFGGSELDIFKPDILIALQCVILCFVTSLVLGLLPAIRFSRPSVVAALRNDSAGARRVGRLQKLTAALQAGLAVPFLVIGGVRVDQARVTAMSEPGFQPSGLYAARFNLGSIAKTDDEQQRFVRTVEESLAQASGVTSVSVGDGLPLDFIYRNVRVRPFDQASAAQTTDRQSAFVTAHSTRIGPRYLETVGIRLLAGRAIGVDDSARAERIVLVSEPLAEQLFPGGNPLGQRVDVALGVNEPQTYTIVGITADVVSTQMGNPRPQLFLALAQHSSRTLMVIARGASGDPAVRQGFEHATKSAGPDFELGTLITGEGLIKNSYEDLLTQGAVGSVAAGVALVLASLGVYGVIAFMVATRTREIGVRVALGASRARVLREVLVDALKLVVPGIGVGLVLAVWWVRLVDPAWYPLGGVEPLVYSAAAAVAFGVAVLAGIPSARRAAAVQPIVAMRAE
jgi:putative ABC transport system permease protein